MTAFLKVDIARAYATPVTLRAVPRRVDASRPVVPARWPITPDGTLIRRWHTADPAPEFPPD
jgi:hypothetical protein